jgi:hypothetical protein
MRLETYIGCTLTTPMKMRIAASLRLPVVVNGLLTFSSTAQHGGPGGQHRWLTFNVVCPSHQSEGVTAASLIRFYSDNSNKVTRLILILFLGGVDFHAMRVSIKHAHAECMQP